MPHLKAWFDKLLERPAFETGRHVPTRHTALDPMTEEELEKKALAGRAWVMMGMAKDANK